MRFTRVSVSWACLLIILLLGCSEDKPLAPAGADESPAEDPPTYEPLSNSDEAVDALLVAFAESDSNRFGHVLADDFLILTGRNAGVLGTEELDHETVMQALDRFCRGEPGPYGEPHESLTLELEPRNDWEASEDDPRFDGCLLRDFDVRATITGPQYGWGLGEISVYTKGHETEGGEIEWQVVAIDDRMRPGSDKIESNCLADFIRAYLIGGIPKAVMVLDRMSATTEDGFILEAGESDGGTADLHAEPYRWRNDDGTWEDWQADSALELIIDDPGEHRLTLAVRNEFGTVSIRTQSVNVVAAYPASWDELRDTFEYAHQAMDATILFRCLSVDEFEFVLTEDDVADFEWPRASLGGIEYFLTMMAVFSRDINDDTPLVEQLYLGISVSEEGPAEPEIAVIAGINLSLRRWEADDLYASGPVGMVVGPREWESPQGPITTWQILRIIDQSGQGSWSGQSWGSVLLEYGTP